MADTFVRPPSGIGTALDHLDQVDRMLTLAKRAQIKPRGGIDPTYSELKLILGAMSNGKGTYGGFLTSGPAMYFAPQLSETNLNSEGKAALFHFLWMLGEDDYKKASTTFWYQIAQIRQILEHEMRVAAWQIGTLSLARRITWIDILKKKYGTLSDVAYAKFQTELSFYLTLTGNTAPLLHKDVWTALEPHLRKHNVPRLYTGNTRQNIKLVPYRLAIQDYLGAASQAAALNELYVRCPLLLFLKRHYPRHELPSFLMRKERTTQAVAKLGADLKDSNDTYKKYLGNTPTEMKVEMLLPLLKLGQEAVRKAYPKSAAPYLSSIYIFYKEKAGKDDLADVLSVISNVCTGLGLFFGFTPAALGAGILFSIAGVTEKTILFIHEARKNSIRGALTAYPDSHGFLKVAESGHTLADEFMLVLLELAFLAPGVKQAHTLRKAVAKEAKIIRSSQQAIRKLDADYARKLNDLRLSYTARHRTQKGHFGTQIKKQQTEIARLKTAREGLLHDRGLTQNLLKTQRHIQESLEAMSLEALETTAHALRQQRAEIIKQSQRGAKIRDQYTEMLEQGSAPKRDVMKALEGIEIHEGHLQQQLKRNKRRLAAAEERLRTHSPESFEASLRETQTVTRKLEDKLAELDIRQRTLIGKITDAEAELLRLTHQDMEASFAQLLVHQQRFKAQNQILKEQLKSDMATAQAARNKLLATPNTQERTKEGVSGIAAETRKKEYEAAIAAGTQDPSSSTDRLYSAQEPNVSQMYSTEAPFDWGDDETAPPSTSPPAKKQSKKDLKTQRATSPAQRGL